jgi:hypothetical protein
LKILVNHKLSDGGVEILRNGGYKADVRIGLKPKELRKS